MTALATRPATGVTFGGVLRSEWIKLVTLRSTIWCYVIIVALTIGLGMLLASTFTSDTPLSGEGRQEIWVQAATLSIGFSQLVAAVLGALMITGEYGTGMIRSTLTAVPARLPALVAKALVFGVATFVVSLVSIVATALLTVPVFGARGFAVDLGDGQAWWSLIGGAGYLAIVGILALSIGALIRNSAGGIAASLGLILVVPTIVQIFARITKAVWVSNLGTFLPNAAGERMYTYITKVAPPVAADTVVLDPWQGFLVLLAWVVVLFVIASVLLKRRDA
jgi:ABC-2 type transport system permease protein